MSGGGTEGIDRGTRLALGAMIGGIFLVANDFTALSVAIPEIERDLDTTLNRSQWVINAYTTVFGVLIVTGGRLADMFGRRRIFLVGAAIFGTFSLLGGFAPGPELLIMSRGLMGIGGALMWPSVLGMTYAILPDEKAGIAGGLIIGVAGIGNAFGPFLGGVLTDAISWRWIFFVNVPIAIVAMFLTGKYVAESELDSQPKVDYRGIATLTVGMVLILVALDQGTDIGFGNAAILVLFVVGGLLLVTFAFVERREGSTALVPADLLRDRTFAGAAIATVAISTVIFAVMLYLPQFMENELGFTALEAGVGLFPVMAVFAAVSFAAGPLYDRLGSRTVVLAGTICLTVGAFLLSFLNVDGGYVSIVPGMVITGFGVGLFYSAATTAAVTAVDPSQASLAGGIIYMCNVSGGALGLGLNTAIVLQFESLTEGIQWAFRIDAAFAVVGVLVVAAMVGDRSRQRAWHPRLHLHHRAHG